jgi:phage terminase small subunit
MAKTTPTDKQQLFISEYLKCWNATEAARRAGYRGNDNVLAVTGHDNLRNPKIAEIIQARIAEKAMSADEVLVRLAEQARGNLGDFLTFYEGSRFPLVDLSKSPDKQHIVKKFKNSKRDGVEIELYDAQAALVHIGKHHGLFTDKIEVKLAKEIESILGVIEGVLDADGYQRVLQAIIGSGEGGPEETQPDSGS